MSGWLTPSSSPFKIQRDEGDYEWFLLIHSLQSMIDALTLKHVPYFPVTSWHNSSEPVIWFGLSANTKGICEENSATVGWWLSLFPQYWWKHLGSPKQSSRPHGGRVQKKQKQLVLVHYRRHYYQRQWMRRCSSLGRCPPYYCTWKLHTWWYAQKVAPWHDEGCYIGHTHASSCTHGLASNWRRDNQCKWLQMSCKCFTEYFACNIFFNSLQPL